MSLGYGFVDYTTHQAAAQALEAMNGRAFFGLDLRVGWAHAATKTDESGSGGGGAAAAGGGGGGGGSGSANHIFIGDLSTDIEDKTLYDAFSPFGPIMFVLFLNGLLLKDSTNVFCVVKRELCGILKLDGLEAMDSLLIKTVRMPREPLEI